MTQEKTKQAAPVLDNAHKQRLRALGHELRPLVLIGKAGADETLVASADAALKSHELVKVKLERNAPLAREEAARLLTQALNAALVQQIGRTFLLYRPNPDLPPGRRITLAP